MDVAPSTSGVKKKQRAKHCFVPGCTTGYRSAKEKQTLFAVPKDPVLFSQWDRNIPRGDTHLQENSAVCALHFDEWCIERYFSEVRVDGDVVRIARTIPLLASHAVPTVFPNLPKYLTKKTPRKRKDRSTKEGTQPAKCFRTRSPPHTESASLPASPVLPVPARPVSNMLKDCCDGVTLPSSKWLRHPFPDCTVFADVHLNTCKSTLLADKFVSVTEPALSDGEKLTCTLLLRGSPHKKEELTTAAELHDFLEHANRLELCIGAGRCEEFLPLQMCDTSTTTLKKYLRRYESGFGFNQATFTALKEKTADMSELQCHGGLVLDEMKLSENVAVQASGRAEGFVDLGPFTPEEQKGVLADHGMVLLFQPFCGKWTQILGVFASHGNVKADLFAKIIVDAVLLAEQAGLFIDYVCCDAASWNRSMWRQFGIKAGREHIVEAWKCDSNSLTLRAMPRITHSHLFPNAFEKMRVNLAFHLFSEEVERGLHLYHEQIQGARGNLEGTLQLHKRISTLIRVMTSRCPYDALRPGSHQAKFLDSFLDYLDEWEVAAKDDCFVSQSTAEGLRVTLHSTKSLLQYLTTLGYRYIMTARLSQDCIERLFGIIRQSSGPNDHPTPVQFLILANCLSFYNLAKSPTGGSVSKGVLSSLLCAEDTETRARDQLDDLLEAGKLHEVEEALVEDDHASCIEETSDSRLIYYMAGYAARKCITKKGGCGACKSISLRTSTPTAADHPASYTRHIDRGGLLYATDQLFKLISHLEKMFTRCFSRRKLHANSIVDILSCVGANVPAVGCGEHKTELTNSIMRFYLITRLHFYVKQKNKMRNQRKKKQQLSKQGRLL
ncbi:uncharacterized protein ISCGN_016638 [Ixodes scapularis]